MGRSEGTGVQHARRVTAIPFQHVQDQHPLDPATPMTMEIQTREVFVPLDVGYLLGLSGPSQGTSRTDHLGTFTVKDTAGVPVAKLEGISITVTELRDANNQPFQYHVVASMLVTALDHRTGDSSPMEPLPAWIFDFRNVARGVITSVQQNSSVLCSWNQHAVSLVWRLSVQGWLQDWASTSMRVEGDFYPCS